MAMVIHSAELTDKDENGFQGVILWHKDGIPLVTLRVDSYAPHLEPYHREMTMCDLLDVLQDGTREPDAELVRLRAALDAMTAERDAFRAVLEGAEYGDIDGIAKSSPEHCRALGKAVGDASKALVAQRDAARAKALDEAIEDFPGPAYSGEMFRGRLLAMKEAEQKLIKRKAAAMIEQEDKP